MKEAIVCDMCGVVICHSNDAHSLEPDDVLCEQCYRSIITALEPKGKAK